MKPLSILLLLCFSFSVYAQQTNAVKVREYYKNLDEQNNFIAECEEKTRKSQIEEFGGVSIPIAGECEWGNNGCPISLIVPQFPELARNFNIFGSVKVEIITDKKGSVIYAKAVNGKTIFHYAAQKAAFYSTFYPKMICGKFVCQKRIINYNFVL